MGIFRSVRRVRAKSNVTGAELTPSTSSFPIEWSSTQDCRSAMKRLDGCVRGTASYGSRRRRGSASWSASGRPSCSAMDRAKSFRALSWAFDTWRAAGPATRRSRRVTNARCGEATERRWKRYCSRSGFCIGSYVGKLGSGGNVAEATGVETDRAFTVIEWSCLGRAGDARSELERAPLVNRRTRP
jgi:hypothetical protein